MSEPKWSPPWSILPDWKIVGMNHYKQDGEARLFVALTKGGKCIQAEGPDDKYLWNRLWHQAQAEDEGSGQPGSSGVDRMTAGEAAKEYFDLLKVIAAFGVNQARAAEMVQVLQQAVDDVHGRTGEENLMESYADQLRRIADALDRDFAANLLSSLGEILSIAKSMVSECA